MEEPSTGGEGQNQENPGNVMQNSTTTTQNPWNSGEDQTHYLICIIGMTMGLRLKSF